MPCKYAEFGCDLLDEDHEEKKPIKHLTLVNDEARILDQKLEQLSISNSELETKISTLKVQGNGFLCRQTPQLLWKISDWKNKLKFAELNQQLWISSSVFDSEPFGYKMMAIIAPFGHNHGFGNAFSIFVQILPGDFDDILKWPFDKSVVMTLYDQRQQLTQRKNYQYEIKTAKTPKNYPFLQRPINDQPNPPFGCDLFCPLKAVVDSTFVKNDQIIIGIHVF